MASDGAPTQKRARTQDATARVLLTTANVGSVFELPEKLEGNWISSFVKTVEAENPLFIALHMQEVGGKSFEDGKLSPIDFAKHIQQQAAMKPFQRMCGFLDMGSGEDQFTALGCLYFLHDDLKDVKRWNFETSAFEEYKDDDTVVTAPGAYHDKTKFKEGQFGQARKSRKGCVIARWQIDSQELDLVNVHLFHDAHNIEASERSPSPYARSRQESLEYVIEHAFVTKAHRAPEDAKTQQKRIAASTTLNNIFVFGDFNFRLALDDVILHVCERGRPVTERAAGDNTPVRSTYKSRLTPDTPRLVMEKKVFQFNDPALFARDGGKQFRQFDREPVEFDWVLSEQPVHYAPTYPFTEEEEDATYSATRCPAWCDRVLMSHAAASWVASASPVYTSLAPTTSVGDHKPVILAFNLPSSN